MIRSIVDRRVALALVTDVADNLSKPIEEKERQRSSCVKNVFFLPFQSTITSFS